MSKKIKSKNLVSLQQLLQITIVLMGLISVPLHIIFSPNPYVSLTKFTIQSNIIVTLIFMVGLLMKNRKSHLLDLLKNSALIYMIIVISIYHFILARGGVYSGTRIITNFTLHYLMPILVFSDWIFFEEKKLYSYKSIFFILLYPIIYVAISLIRGMVDGFYPYFFLNPNKSFPDGVGNYINVLLVLLGLALIYCSVGFFVILLNRVIFKSQNRTEISRL